MLVDYEYKGNNLVTSYIDDNGNIKMKYIPWSNPKKYVTCHHTDSNKDEQFITWDGRNVKQIPVKYPRKHSVYDFLDHLDKDTQDTLFSYKEPNIFFIDIENEILDKKPQPHLAESAIQSISIVHKDFVWMLGTKKLSEEEKESIKNDIENYFKKFDLKINFKHKYFKSEYDLVLYFFNMTKKMAVLTGWNFVEYDWTFLVNRARRLKIPPEMSSFTNKLRSSFDPRDFKELPAHRIVVDYMELHKKWDTAIKVKESASLDFVSEKLLGIKKVNYEGNLTQLYENDYKKFIFYNAVDSILVQKIHEKMKYINIMFGISVLSKIKVTDAFSTLAVTEGIIRNELRDQKNVVLCKLDDEDGYIDPNIVQQSKPKMIKGGWVKKPFRGMQTWVCCYDFASLYPTTMREFNISADSYKGQAQKNKEFSIYNGQKLEIKDDDIITLNGAVFKNEDGVIKQVMGNIYTDRKNYKGQMKKANLEIDHMKQELEQLKREVGEF